MQVRLQPLTTDMRPDGGRAKVRFGGLEREEGEMELDRWVIRQRCLLSPVYLSNISVQELRPSWIHILANQTRSEKQSEFFWEANVRKTQKERVRLLVDADFLFF